MRILGIDPGVATTGWAIVDYDNDYHLVDFGVITTSKANEQPDRLVEIYNDINDIVSKYSPEYGGIELLLFNSNAKTVMAVGESRGVVILALRKLGLPILQFTPPQVKSTIAGSGRADKKQVQENVKRLFNLDKLPSPDDAADAVAVAVCCIDSIVMKQKANINV